MKWEKCSTDLSNVLAGALAGIPAQRRVMFGCPTYFVNGNMFTGVHQSNIIIRLSEPDRNLMLREFDEAAPFEPMPGRVMKEYVTVPAAVFDRPDTFGLWLAKSFKTVSALPPKVPKAYKAKKG